ncbi:MAG: pectate lyase [Longimicrobiaceae bacterium]
MVLSSIMSLLACAPAVAQTSPVDSIARLPGAAVERDTTPLLGEARLARMHAAERALWTAYLRRSRELRERDRALVAGELRARGRARMERAPFVRESFELKPWMRGGWFRSDSAKAIAEAILSFQTPSGGWSKHVDLRAGPRRPGQSFFSETDEWQYIATLDNNATTSEMRYLALAGSAVTDPRYPAAFLRGVDYLLAAQLPSGCWPQVWPLQGGYHDAATFNDDATVNAAALLRDVAKGDYGFVHDAEREQASRAFGRAVSCILRTQVRDGGRLSIWGQQHDPLTLRPTGARSYELASLATKESAGIMRLLMSIPSPDARVAAAVHAAAAWFRANAIYGYSYDFDTGRRAQPGAGPLWARMVEIGTGRPIFANRDGVKLYDYERLTDRRTGYGWYSEEPAAALRQYERWSRRHPALSPAPWSAIPSPVPGEGGRRGGGEACAGACRIGVDGAGRGARQCRGIQPLPVRERWRA